MKWLRFCPERVRYGGLNGCFWGLSSTKRRAATAAEQSFDCLSPKCEGLAANGTSIKR